MRIRSCAGIVWLFALLLMSSGECVAQRPRDQVPVTPAIPDTPAGRQFAAWLDAFNDGKRETMRRFIEDNFDLPPGGALPAAELAEHDMVTFRETGGLRV